MGTRHNTRTETLEHLIRRVTTDARAVNAPMTPTVLAGAIRAGQWTHRTGSDLWLADLIRNGPTDPHHLAVWLDAHGWKHRNATATIRTR